MVRTGIKLKHQNQFIQQLMLPWNEFIDKVGQADNYLVRKRLFLEQEGRCNRCDSYEWLGEPIALELEHKNGDHHDNSRDNIEILCPNCHALTPTWRGRNKRKKYGTISDDVLVDALRTEPSIRKALIKVGMAGKGNNYQRCHRLIVEHGLITQLVE
jgi:hypothetical protein